MHAQAVMFGSMRIAHKFCAKALPKYPVPSYRSSVPNKMNPLEYDPLAQQIIIAAFLRVLKKKLDRP